MTLDTCDKDPLDGVKARIGVAVEAATKLYETLKQSMKAAAAAISALNEEAYFDSCRSQPHGNVYWFKTRFYEELNSSLRRSGVRHGCRCSRKQQQRHWRRAWRRALNALKRDQDAIRYIRRAARRAEEQDSADQTT